MTDISKHSSDWHSPLFVRLMARVAAWIWRWGDDRDGQRPAIGRLTAHIALVLVIAVLVVLGALRLDSPSAIVRVADKTLLEGFVQNVDAAAPVAAEVERPYYRAASQARIVRQAQVHTAVPDRPRLEITTYTVGPGDTTEKIAESFDLQPTTLLWSNPELEKMPDLLRVGQELVILPIDGVYHTVAVSDTLESIAQAYKVDVEAIASCPFNAFAPNGTPLVGSSLIVPGGSKPYETREVTTYVGPVPVAAQALGVFNWPASGVLTQGYWYGHRAIDIGASVGAAIWASDSGFVAFAGWTDIGYGYLIVVDHQNGYQTYYAHLSDIFVREGEVVEGGQVIGAMGSTGNSTGPHLHFEIRYDSYPTNPLIYLH
ncbi:MAG: peptidoglycan DD-metalloendopeptidase family protein [Anaerolineae bacterium]|nr:peptidoglycan DD-metalloendopeptidase family protein [Anaerolineae bacterium]